jgi:hypothetical protein
MSDNIRCLAITKLGHQCKLKRNSKLFCYRHIKTKPDNILLDGEDVFQKIIQYTTEDNYFKTLNKFLQLLDNKKNDENIIKDNKCIVCLENINNTDILLISCSNKEHNHQVCNECLKGHIISMLNDGIASLECMFDKADKCGGTYTENNIQNCLQDEEIFKKWTENSISCYITKLAGICDNYLICPLCCKWGCIFDTPHGLANKQPFYISCEQCNQQWCTLCKRKSHSNRSCYELQFQENENLEKRISIIDKMLQDITTRILTHCCTICGCTYIKEEGCNLMTCPKCNGMSCYICGMKLYMKNNTKYWHFTGHDLANRDANCPLWNNIAGDGKDKQGNTEYNMNLLKNELNKFINTNKNIKGGEHIINLIKSRIYKLFEKDKNYKQIMLITQQY